MITNQDSLLRNLPVGMDIRQGLRLDAIRYSVDAIDELHSELREHLSALEAQLGDTKPGGSESVLVDARLVTRVAFLAWGLVDWADRFRKIVSQTPGLPTGQNPSLRMLIQYLQQAEVLRDAFQHLDREVASGLAQRQVQPILGAISWSCVHAESHVTGYLLQFGCQIAGVRFPLAFTVDGMTGQITDEGTQLHAYGRVLNLSELNGRVASFANWLDTSFEYLEDSSTAPSDVLTALTVELHSGDRPDPDDA